MVNKLISILKNLFHKPPKEDLPLTHLIGLWGEEEAAQYLRKKGYKILATRLRPNAHNDELDIIAQTTDTIIFVEVKTRATENFGRAASSVDTRKRRALCRAASAFIRKSSYPRCYYRFDIIEIIGTRGTPPTITHIENAFQFPSHYRF